MSESGLLNTSLSEFQTFTHWPGMLRTLQAWNVRTIGDLTKCGVFRGVPYDEFGTQGLIDLRGVGVRKVNLIRAFLFRYGLQLVDEDEVRNAPWADELTTG